MISNQEFSYIFSSADENDPVDKIADGTQFSVRPNHPFTMPANAFDCTAEVVSASMWNSVPNVSVGLANNKFYVYYGGALYTVEIPDGLYSVSSLNATVSKSLVNQGLPADVVAITGNQSTQSIVLSFNYVGSYADFTQTNACRVLLGFDARLAPLIPTTIVGQSEDGDEVAEFNNIERFLLKTDLVNGNIPTNQNSDQTVASVPIQSKTGDQVVYSPINPIRVDCSNLRGIGRDVATFRITDEKGEPAITNEAWSMLMVFRYKIKI
jgi:hypothetical protein